MEQMSITETRCCKDTTRQADPSPYLPCPDPPLLSHDPHPAPRLSQVTTSCLPIWTSAPGCGTLSPSSTHSRTTMTAKPSSVRATSAVSPSRYVGKVCDKHPELDGLRLIRNYTCVGCMRDQKRKSRSTTGLSPEQRREAKVRYVSISPAPILSGLSPAASTPRLTS